MTGLASRPTRGAASSARVLVLLAVLALAALREVAADPCSVANCLDCYPESGYLCAECNTTGGFYLDDGQCYPRTSTCIVASCERCVGDLADVCEVCADGFYANAQGLCVARTASCLAANCTTCAGNEQNTCAKCDSGFFLRDGACRALATSCRVDQCQLCADTAAECLYCRRGTYLTGATNSKCRTATDVCNVQHCELCVGNDMDRCQVCAYGYRVNTTTQRCDVREGYGLPETTPSPTTSGSPAPTTEPSTEAPRPCLVSNCQRCVAAFPAQCEACVTGWYLNTQSKTCQATRPCYASACKACATDSETVCDVCEASYVKSSAGTCVLSSNAVSLNSAGSLAVTGFAIVVSATALTLA